MTRGENPYRDLSLFYHAPQHECLVGAAGQCVFDPPLQSLVAIPGLAFLIPYTIPSISKGFGLGDSEDAIQFWQPSVLSRIGFLIIASFIQRRTHLLG